MALLRKRYYSVSRNAWIDINTNQTATNNSRDIRNLGSIPEKIRLITYDGDFSSSTLMDLISDLVYNDVQTLEEAGKIGSILSNGVFVGVGNSFEIDVVELVDGPNLTRYISKFLIQDGLINKSNETAQRKTSIIVKKLRTTNNSPVMTATQDTDIRDLKVGMLVRHPSFVFGTQIESINLLTKTITMTANASSTTPTPIDFVFTDEGVFFVGTGGFEPIVNNTGVENHPPLYRRDLIELGVNGEYNILRGIESTISPPIHTVLDSYYKIDSITWRNLTDNPNIYRVALSTNITRNFENEFYVGKEITLLKTANGDLDNIPYTITEIGTNSNQYIDILIPGIRGTDYNQSLQKGFVDSGFLGLYSVELYKHDKNSVTLIGQTIERIFESVGIISGVNEIYRARLVKDEFGVYSIKTKDRVHLTDAVGRWLEYKSGQSPNVPPSAGFSYADNVLTNDDFDNTQLPQEFDAINISSLANVPFIFNDIQDNIFNQQSFTLDSFIIGVKNDTPTIGDEGIEAEIVQPTVRISSDLLTATQISAVSTSLTCQLSFAGVNLSTLGVVPGDLLFVSNGSGQYQSAQITLVSTNTITTVGFTKRPETTSKYIIFQNAFTVLPNSSTTIGNSELKSQVIGGTNGRFGNLSAYSKVKLTFGNTPSVQKGVWYFLRIKGKNEGITWGNLPYIVTENPYGTNTTSRNAYIQVNYKILNGTYGLDNFFHLEDSFGDLKDTFAAREVQPHFRPSKYIMVAKPLRDDSAHPLSPETVFVDVTGGKILFHPQGEPIEVFAYYHKINVLSGDSTDFSIRHRNATMTKEVTMQDKISELSSIFRDGTSFERPITVNGILNKTVNGFRGPVEVREDDPYRLIYKEEEFTNHTNTKDDYNARVSTSVEYSIVKLEKNAVVISDPVDLTPAVFNDSFITGASNNIIIPTPALDEENRLIVPISESVQGTIEADSKLKLKAWNKIPAFSLFQTDGTLVDTTIGTKNHDGSWNDFHSYPYNNRNVLKFVLRKRFFENLSYPAEIENKRYWKTREVLKNVTDILNNYSGSTSQIISEKYLTVQKNGYEGVEQDGEYFIFPYTETTKYSKFYVQESENTELKDIEQFDAVGKTIKFITNSVITTTLTNGTSQKYLYTLLTDPNSIPSTDRPVLKREIIAKSNSELDYNEMTAFNLVSTDTVEIGTSGTSEILTGKIIDYSNELFALVIGYQDDDTAYKIDIIWFNKADTTLATEVKKITISEDSIDPIDSQIFSTAIMVAPYTLAVAYKKSTKSVFRIVKYDPFIKVGASLTISDPFTFTTSTLIETPVLQKFSRNSFLIFHSDSTHTAIKKFDAFGNAENFGNAIDELVLTTLNPTEGAGVQTVELSNNDIFVLWSEKETISGQEYRNTFIATIDEWATLSDPANLFLEKVLNKTKIAKRLAADKYVDWSAAKLNSDIVLVSRRNGITDLSIFAYQINGVQNPNPYTRAIPLGQDWRKFQIVPFTDNGVIYLYNNFTTSKIHKSVVEYRPNFIDSILEFSKTNNSFTSSYSFSKEIGDNKSIFVTTDAGVNTVRLVDTSISDSFRVIGSTTFTDTFTDIDVLKFTINRPGIGDREILAVAFTLNIIKFKFYDITTVTGGVLSPFEISGTNQHEINESVATKVKFYKLGEQTALVNFVIDGTTIRTIPVKLSGFDEATLDFNTIFGQTDPGTITPITITSGVKYDVYVYDETTLLFSYVVSGVTKFNKAIITIDWKTGSETAETTSITYNEATIFDFASNIQKIKSFKVIGKDVVAVFGNSTNSLDAYYDVSYEQWEPYAWDATGGNIIYVENNAAFSLSTNVSFSDINRETVRFIKTPTTYLNQWNKKTFNKITTTEYAALSAAVWNGVGTPSIGQIRNLTVSSNANRTVVNVVEVNGSNWKFFETFSATNPTDVTYNFTEVLIENSNYLNAFCTTMINTSSVKEQVIEVAKDAVELNVNIPISSKEIKYNTTDTLEFNDSSSVVSPVNGTKVVFYWSSDNDAEGCGITQGTEYYIVNSSSQTFKLSTSFGGSAISITSFTDKIILQYVGFTPTVNMSVNLALDTAKTISAVNTTSETITTSATHGFTTGEPVIFTGSLPTPLVAATVYYVSVVDTTNFKVHTTRTDALAGTNIVNLTTTTTGGTVRTAAFTLASHGFITAELTRFTASVFPTLISGSLNGTTDYFIIPISTSRFAIATSSANATTGTAIGVTSAGTTAKVGTNTFTIKIINFPILSTDQKVKLSYTPTGQTGTEFPLYLVSTDGSAGTQTFRVVATFGSNLTERIYLPVGGNFQIDPYLIISTNEAILDSETTEAIWIQEKTSTQITVRNKGAIAKGSILNYENKINYYVTSTPTVSGSNWIFNYSSDITDENVIFREEDTALISAKYVSTTQVSLPVSNVNSEIANGRKFYYVPTTGDPQVLTVSSSSTLSGVITFSLVETIVSIPSGGAGSAIVLFLLPNQFFVTHIKPTTISKYLRFDTNILEQEQVLIKEIDFINPISRKIYLKDAKKIKNGTSTIVSTNVLYTRTSTSYKKNILTEKVLDTGSFTPNSLSASFYNNENLLVSYLTATSAVLKEFEIMGLNTEVLIDRVYNFKGVDDTSYSPITYFSSAIKFSGNNYRGEKLESFPVYKLDNKAVVNNNGTTTPNINMIPFSMFKKDESNFSVVYQPLDSSTTNYFYMRDFKILNKKIFIDSNFYITELFDFTEQPLYNKYLHAVQLERELFYVWKETNGTGTSASDSIQIALVDYANNIINANQKTVVLNEKVFVESVEISGSPTPTVNLFVPELGPIVLNKTISYNGMTTTVEAVTEAEGGWVVTVDSDLDFPTNSGFIIDLSLPINENKRRLSILGMAKLVENFVTFMIYDSIAKVFYTPIFDKNLNQVTAASWFSIDKFNLETDQVSDVTIDDFGNFYWYYKNLDTTSLKYYTHGIGGGILGIVQMVGKI